MIKKYKVKKKHPKPIMNCNRLVTLKPKSFVYLKYEGQMKQLVRDGVLEEVIEFHKPQKKVKQEEPKKQIKQPKKFKKSEAPVKEAVLEEKLEQE